MSDLPRRTPLVAWSAMSERAPARSDFDAFAGSEVDDPFAADRLRLVRDAIETIPDEPDS
ncbi:hypothetical protein ACFCXK_08925 [Streptomyces sp. NPDC056269]|uniref:hypothetical protein n=1 Tax=Streptomyces sp. NPDC056269 TaxID=3345768 RepID=UPI0035D9FE65